MRPFSSGRLGPRPDELWAPQTPAPANVSASHRAGIPGSPAASPLAFAEHAIAGFKVGPRHLTYFNRIALRCAANRKVGRQTFIVIEASRRHGKSWFWSLAFPAWWKGVFPDDGVIEVGHSQDFATQWGRGTRDLLRDHGGPVFGVDLDPSSRAFSRWELKAHQHRYIAVGVGGSLTGETGHLIVVDDPVKGWVEAQSAEYREKQWQWYGGTLRSILEPNGVIVVVMSRWHEDDLSGRLQAQWRREQEDAARHDRRPVGDPWEVIRLPAVAEPTPDELLAMSDEDARQQWRDVLGRAEGEPLWPKRYDRDALERFARTQPVVWAASWQQRPSVAEGGEFRRADWRYIDYVPWERQLSFVRRWDLAGTKATGRNEPDWTAGVLMGRDEFGAIYVVDVQRFREDSPEVRRRMAQTAAADGPSVLVRMARDPGQAGIDQASNMARTVMAPYAFAAFPETGSKVVRAQPWAAAVAQARPDHGGRPVVYLLRAPWNEDFVEEHRQFPNGAHDDQVDAAANAYLDLVGAYPLDMDGVVVNSTAGGR